MTADSVGLQDDDWALRYYLVDQLINLLNLEEEYWRQCGRRLWLLKGDANIVFFPAFANGRRRKCNISSLSTYVGPITDKMAIHEHIYTFYLELFATDSPCLFSLRRDFWTPEHCVSEEENLALSLSFLPRELDEVLKDTKTDTAPRPDGFPVAFYKAFWPLVRGLVLHILNGFALGMLDISRLNFGIISLIPKIPGADTIKQFRPIALINVIFKLISKAYANRLVRERTGSSLTPNLPFSRAGSSMMVLWTFMK